MVTKYSSAFRFIGVYIEEAHAVDEWPICEAPREFRQHRSLQERRAACDELLRDYDLGDMPFYLDDMTNSFNSTYASWPFRFWVITKEQIAFKPMPQNAMYDLNELESFLSAGDIPVPAVSLET